MRTSNINAPRNPDTHIFDSYRDVRVVIRTTNRVLVDCRAAKLEVEDARGRFTLDAASPATMVAVVPSDILVHKRDGSCLRIHVSWGSLTAVGSQIRIIARDAHVVAGDPLPIAV